jgi:dsRNA-specific ribonuclease
MTTTPLEQTTVKTAITAASVMNHVKNNRLEYIGLIILGHLLGLSDRLLAQLNGVCF